MIPLTIKLLDINPGSIYCGVEINNVESYKLVKEKILQGNSLLRLVEYAIQNKTSSQIDTDYFLKQILQQSKEESKNGLS